jgi:hypothetical protein
MVVVFPYPMEFRGLKIPVVLHQTSLIRITQFPIPLHHIIFETGIILQKPIRMIGAAFTPFLVILELAFVPEHPCLVVHLAIAIKDPLLEVPLVPCLILFILALPLAVRL